MLCLDIVLFLNKSMFLKGFYSGLRGSLSAPLAGGLSNIKKIEYNH